MTLTAVIILCISATVHAAWNFVGKKGNCSPASFLLATILGCACLSPVAILSPGIVAAFSPEVWALLVITGFFQAIYYVGLAGAYRTGDMSIAYPLARSAPVLMVAGINLLIGRGHELTLLSVVGMMLIATGGLVLPIRSMSEWKPRDLLHLSGLMAMVAAIGTCGYSMVDDHALRILRSMSDISAGRTMLTLNYALIEGLSATFWLVVFVLTTRSGRASFADTVRFQARDSLLAGIGIYLAYSMVLIAMGFVANVSYVVAFRQLSIPLGAMFGVLLLKEPHYPAKMLGVAAMFVGLVLVAVG
ncbi:MAG: multidrug DMT transporter permease [Armatimonadetes bacterium]|nr:multidrug DMT transporter permease [Armatimonadota bacterium]